MVEKHAGPVAKSAKTLQRWFNLGLDVDQFDYKERIQHVERKFADDNMRVMQGVCVGAAAIAFLLMLSRCQIHGWTALNTVPFVASILICAVCGIIANRFGRNIPTALSISLVDLLSASWYIMGIYANVVLQPEKPSVLMCLMFMAVPMIFDSMPRRTFSMSAFWFAAMLWTEFTLVSESVMHTDVNNAIISVFIGLGCSRMKSAAKVDGLLYLDMFKTATKTTEIVAQINLRRNSFVILQIPNSAAYIPQGCERASQLIARIADEFIAPEWKDRFAAFVDVRTLSARMGDAKQMSLEYQTRNGSWNQMTVVEEHRKGKRITAVVMVVRSINEEKRQELMYREQLHAAATEAERANASKSNFLRRMSHDIRTPINGIRGIVKIADRFPDDAQKQTECRRKVMEASDYLLMLVNNVLDMSKLESGAIELENKPFEMRALLDEITTIARMQATEHGVAYFLDVNDADVEHNRLIGSPLHLRQILHNLVSNAIKYNREGGSVVMRCREIAYDGSCAQFRLTVEDTGLGMSQEFIKHAFEPFTQEEQKQSRTTYAGSGLGLSIVKEFTESMGGRVELSSALGVGTQFTLTIPFQINYAPPMEQAAAEATINLAGKQALVAEDNELNREITEFVLHDIGLEVTCVRNGKEAVERFRESEPGYFDVVFMDIMMPVMDGLEATRAIRALERPDAKRVPVLAMTANAFQDDAKRSMEAGINEHLTKPLEVDKITAALQRWLR